METIEPVDNSTVDNDPGCIDAQIAAFVNATSKALETTEADEETIEEVEAAGEALVDTLEEATVIVEEDDVSDREESGGGEEDQSAPKEDEADEDDDVDVAEVQDLLFKQIENQKDRREVVNRRLSTLEEEVFEDNPHSSSGKHHAAPCVTPQTPLEDLARLPERNTCNESENVKRALFIARDVADYATSVPGGWQIPWSDLRRVLKAGTDSGHPQTVKRVMEILERFGEGTVRIVDKEEYEKRIVFEDEAVKRLHVLCQDDENENHGNVSAETG